MSLVVQQFLELVKSGLAIASIDYCYFQKEVDWNVLLEISQKQGLLGVTFLGLKSLPEEFRPPELVIMTWYGYSNLLVTRNKVLNKRSHEITYAFSKDGFRSVVMKGQSTAFLYKYPDYRTSGDIDIWVEGARKDIIKYLRSKSNIRHIQFHHADYDFFQDVEVEVHFMPTLLYNYFDNKRLQDIFYEEKEKSMSNKVLLSDSYEINMLTPRANVLLQIVHMYRHFLFAGIGFRQIVDFYVTIVNSSITKKIRNTLQKDIKRVGMIKFTSALMWVLHNTLGMQAQYYICDPDENEGKYLLNEILLGGNLGQYDSRYKTSRYSKLKGYVYITYQSLRVVSHYPSDCFWYFVYRTAQGGWKLINRYN